MPGRDRLPWLAARAWGHRPVRKNGGERGGVDRQKVLSEQGEPAGWVAPAPPPEPPRGSWRTIKMGIHLCCGGPWGADSWAAPEPARGEGVVRARGARVRRPPASRVCFLPLTPQPRGFPPRPAGPGRQRWSLHAPPGPAAGRAQEHAVARQEEPGTGTRSAGLSAFCVPGDRPGALCHPLLPAPSPVVRPSPAPRRPRLGSHRGHAIFLGVPLASLPRPPPHSHLPPVPSLGPAAPRAPCLPAPSSFPPTAPRPRGTEGNRHRPLLFPFPLHR